MFQTVRELSLSRNKNTAQVAALAPLIWSARITATNNDAEESATGAISLFDKDLDLGGDDGTALVGLRFQDVMIPQGATITKAYLEFTAEETKTALTSLIVRAEISDNSVAFVTTEKTLLLRDKFATEASWKKLLLWTSGNVEQSPDISQVIQKVVDRPLWKSGNALSLFITGEGDRDAHSYDSDPLRAPLLYIEYTSAATTTSAPVPIPVPTPTPVIPPAQTPVPTPIPVPQPPIVSSPLLPAPEPLPPAPIPSLSCPAINETVEVGDCVRTLGALNVRSGAGGKIIGKQKNDRGGTIIGGPIGTKGMRWWNIDYHQGVDGWSADSLFEELSSPLLSSDMRIKTFERVNVRSAPNG